MKGQIFTIRIELPNWSGSVRGVNHYAEGPYGTRGTPTILEILPPPVPTRTWAKKSQSWQPLTGTGIQESPACQDFEKRRLLLDVADFFCFGWFHVMD